MKMCKRSFAARVLAVLTALSSAAGTAAAAPSFAIAVHFSPSERSAPLVRAMTEEVSAIWGPYGVNFVWSAGRDDGDSAGTDGSFVVVIQRGRQPNKSGPAVLGFTQLTSGSVDRAPVIVDRDAVEQTLDSLHSDRVSAITGHQRLMSREIGRALGRVLAHEIGHVLLAQRAHQPQGLMRASYVADDLAALRRDSFTLSTNEIERLRARCEALRDSIDAQSGLANAAPGVVLRPDGASTMRNEPAGTASKASRTSIADRGTYRLFRNLRSLKYAQRFGRALEESTVGRNENRRSGLIWGATQSAP